MDLACEPDFCVRECRNTFRDGCRKPTQRDLRRISIDDRVRLLSRRVGAQHPGVDCQHIYVSRPEVGEVQNLTRIESWRLRGGQAETAWPKKGELMVPM
jgi:hypothetical protein